VVTISKELQKKFLKIFLDLQTHTHNYLVFLLIPKKTDYENKQPLLSLQSFPFDKAIISAIQETHPLKVNVLCTLEEFYNGCSKEVSYKRNIVDKKD